MNTFPAFFEIVFLVGKLARHLKKEQVSVLVEMHMKVRAFENEIVK